MQKLSKFHSQGKIRTGRANNALSDFIPILMPRYCWLCVRVIGKCVNQMNSFANY
jgi:hypothetical protein